MSPEVLLKCKVDQLESGCHLLYCCEFMAAGGSCAYRRSMVKRKSSATKLLGVYSWQAAYCLLLFLAEGRGVVR